MSCWTILLIVWASIVLHEIGHAVGNRAVGYRGLITLAFGVDANSEQWPKGITIGSYNFKFGWRIWNAFCAVYLTDRPVRDQVIVTLSGPLANLVIAIIAVNIFLISGWTAALWISGIQVLGICANLLRGDGVRLRSIYKNRR